MKIKMLESVAGLDFSFTIGEEYVIGKTISDKRAKEFLEKKLAVSLEVKAKKTSTKKG